MFIDELPHLFKDSQELLDKRGDFARVRVWQIEDRVPEVGYERDDKMVGGRGAIEGEIIDGGELFGGKGEGYGGEEGWWGRGGSDVGGRLGGAVERGRHVSVELAGGMRLDGLLGCWGERSGRGAVCLAGDGRGSPRG